MWPRDRARALRLIRALSQVPSGAPGDAVKRGEVLAAIGARRSTGPHLHFHVADAPSPLGGEGMPFAIDRFELLGCYDDIGTLGQAPWSERPGSLSAQRRNERPGPNDVISLPGAVRTADSD